MKNHWVYVCSAMLLGACDSGVGRSEWEMAPRVYQCTPEQQQRVERETKWCSDNTSYYTSYCYGTAFMRNCSKAQKPAAS